jgi:hypothetical protein
MHTRRIIDAPLTVTADHRDGDVCNDTADDDAAAAADDDDDDACKYNGATVYCLLYDI